MNRRLTILIAALCTTLTAPAQSTLRQSIQHTLDTAHINGGIAISGIDFQDSLTIHGFDHYPMESVYKFPQAIALLLEAKDEKQRQRSLSLRRSGLDTDTWSPMLKDFSGQRINITIGDLLKYSVSKSDNNACDVIFQFMAAGATSGTGVVNNIIHNLGITGMAIAATEAQMKADWQAQYVNWCQPYAMAQLLARFYQGKILSRAGTQFLLSLMTDSENPTDRIKGQLPPGTMVAHKTGTSGTNKKGLTGGVNDVGIVTLPNGHHYALVVYCSNYYGSTAKGANVIATISKLVWNYYTAVN